ncbi:MAG TPA: sensor histidine kinase, partial [Actinotalea sp.]|nr:sensor histidine kinase [Actinotalea sp.]
MTGSIHWPTAVLVAGTMLLLWLSAWLLRRNRRRGFLSEVDRATYATLHTASLASQHLGDGLTPDSAERAGRHLLSILGAHAVSICDTGGVLSWTGAGEHHRHLAFDLGDETRTTGRTVAHDATQIACTDPDCPIRSAVTAPLVMDDLIVGTLSAWTEHPSPGLAKATEEVAAWVSSQLA